MPKIALEEFVINKRNEFGFSLIEAMITMSIGCIVMVSLAQYTSYIAKQQRQLSARFEKSDLESGVRTQLFSVGTCSCNLKGLRFTNTTGGLKTGFAVPALKTYSSDCTRSTPLAASGQPLVGTQTGLAVGAITMNTGFQVNADTFTFAMSIPLTSTIAAGTKLAIQPGSIENVYVKTKDLGGGSQEVIGCATTNLPELIPNQCYNVTCTSLAGATQTLSAAPSSSGNTLTTMAPSGQGYWVITIDNGAVSESDNCFSDQVMAGGANPQDSGIPACIANARAGANCAVYGSCTYRRGGANPFQSCKFKAC